MVCGPLILGFGSAIIGGGLTIIGILVTYKLETARRDKVDEPRRKLLRQMLDNPQYEWRLMTTLSGVIGSSSDETARLLIEVGARRNELADGADSWGYVKDHPLP